MTFTEICVAMLKDTEIDPSLKWLPSLKRSLRRSLQKMVWRGEFIAIGTGGRGDPFRYFIHPVQIEISATDELKAHYYEIIDDTPGGRFAINVEMARLKLQYLKEMESEQASASEAAE